MVSTVPARRRSQGPGDAVRRPLEWLRRSLTRPRAVPVGSSATTPGRPAVAGLNLRETDDAYLITVPVDGVARGDVEVELRGRRVRIGGQRTRRERVGWLRWRRQPTGWFRIDALLPTAGDPATTSAAFDGDVLNVSVGKRPRDQRRRIPIS